jgi:hypothetical protein
MRPDRLEILSDIVRTLLLYLRRRTATPKRYFASLIESASGRSITDDEWTSALRADAFLRRLGVRCLWRAAIVTELLRQRGVTARIRLFVHTTEPRRAHAECEADGELLRTPPPEIVALQG